MDRTLARRILDDAGTGAADPFYRYMSGYSPYDVDTPLELPVLGTSWRYLFLIARHEEEALRYLDELTTHATYAEENWMTEQLALPPLTEEEGLDLRRAVARAYGRHPNRF
ncbi:hypothetical protein [Asticcacaulis sp.]|uniref:hypothetical protein n=1 Tax=Asticcacaulis sp. TaxID=1872648 RepID=UPI002C6D6222|nr:hypothetical protein [Asticcacaulis sp.]HTM81559.1 hypothetical protein [Asticcacaulis sp.]